MKDFPESSARKRLSELLDSQIVLLDGPMGTMIQSYDLDEEDFRGDKFKDWKFDLKGNNDLLNITRPEIIQNIHDEFIRVGATIIETNTFNSNAPSMADYGMESLVYELNFAGAKLARESADRLGKSENRDIFVAGVLGPTNRTCSLSPDVEDPSYRNINYDQLVDTFTESTEALLDGGADFIFIETIFDTLNAKAAIFAVDKVSTERGTDIPLMISGTITDASGRTLSGQTTKAFWHSVKHAKPISIGLNCALGAEELRPFLKRLSDIADCYVSAHPNAGMPNQFGEYDQTASEMASILEEFASDGFLNIVGGCCGTTPEHIKVGKNQDQQRNL